MLRKKEGANLSDVDGSLIERHLNCLLWMDEHTHTHTITFPTVNVISATLIPSQRGALPLV